jgi:precorrin-2 dehydrogenase / sirohydrochlorin ferrochelatase
MKSPRLFPMFLKLAGRRCLVVGAGTIAESKIASLLEAGANVSVVAPDATPKVRSWAASNRIEWQQRSFQPADLDNMFLVVAATSSPKLHEEIFREAVKRQVLCNIVDVPSLCDFYYPSIIQRGALQIAISTSGQSPALAQRLRKELENQFSPAYTSWLEELGHARDLLFSQNLSSNQRKARLHRLASAASFKAFLKKRRKSKQ